MATKIPKSKLYIAYERVPFRALPGDAELSSRALTEEQFKELLQRCDAFLYGDPQYGPGLETFRAELTRHNITLPTKVGHNLMGGGPQGYRLIAGDLLAIISVMGCGWEHDGRKPRDAEFGYKLLHIRAEGRQTRWYDDRSGGTLYDGPDVLDVGARFPRPSE